MEIMFLRSVNVCTKLDDIRNDEIRRELKMRSVNDRIHENDLRP